MIICDPGTLVQLHQRIHSSFLTLGLFHSVLAAQSANSICPGPYYSYSGDLGTAPSHGIDPDKSGYSTVSQLDGGTFDTFFWVNKAH